MTSSYSSSAAEAGVLIRPSDSTKQIGNSVVLLRLFVYSSNADTQFIQIHDVKDTPADAEVPALSFPIAGTWEQVKDFGDGWILNNGLYICNSSTAATKTIGAADCLIYAQFRQ